MPSRVNGLLLSPAECRSLAAVLMEGCRVIGLDRFRDEHLTLFKAVFETARTSPAGDAGDAHDDSAWDNEVRELNTAEAAEMLGVTPAHVSRLIRSHRLPASKVRGHYRVSTADVEALREERLYDAD